MISKTRRVVTWRVVRALDDDFRYNCPYFLYNRESTGRQVPAKVKYMDKVVFAASSVDENYMLVILIATTVNSHDIVN